MRELNILIVDDNKVDRYMLQRHLKSTSFKLNIAEADDGSTALDHLSACLQSAEPNASKTPNIIFLDINMTLIGGWEFLDKFAVLKQGTSLEDCSVIMYTSSEYSEDKNKIQQHSSVKDYIVKGSFSNDDLKGLLERLTPKSD